MHLTPEQEAYRRDLCQQYVGDQQGFLVAERDAILSGKLSIQLTDEHQEATKAQNDSFLAQSNKTTQEAF